MVHTGNGWFSFHFGACDIVSVHGALCRMEETHQVEAQIDKHILASVVNFHLSNVSRLCLATSDDQEHRGLLSVRYPMEHGIVKDWNDMERIWQYVYSKEQLQTFSEEVSSSLHAT